jgi:flagella basal body P-ring formation protein FlgA
VLAESKVLRITTQAVAKENGIFGDNIQVMNMRSRKNFFAQVVDAQTVKVDFSSTRE